MEDDVIREQRNVLSGNVLGQTFFWMFMGLLATGLIAWYSYSSGVVLELMPNFQMLAIIELVVVLLFSFLFKKLSATLVTVLYFAYAIINGLTFSTIFFVFQLDSIISLFLITAGMFGVLAYIGIKTEKDLSNWGTILSVLLIAGLILSLINLFMGNSMLELILDWVLLIVFGAVTIYDINKIKRMEEYAVMEPEKLYIYGAMEIYLDFINIFIRILSLFGKRNN